MRTPIAMPCDAVLPGAMPAVLGVLHAVRARARWLGFVELASRVVIVAGLVVLLAALLCYGMLAVIPAAVWLALAESGFYWHWVADGSGTPGIRPSAALGLLLAAAWPLVMWLRRRTRGTGAHAHEPLRRPKHPLEPACCLLAAVHRIPGEAAQTLLHLSPGAFTTQLAHDTARALDSVDLSRVVPARPALLGAFGALAAVMVVMAAAGPLRLLTLAVHAREALQGLAGRPERPWVVTIPPSAADRPYILMVTAAPTARLSSTQPPRLIWQSAARRRVIDLEPVGRHSYLIRFNQIRRSVTFAVVGQTRPSSFVVKPHMPTTRP